MRDHVKHAFKSMLVQNVGGCKPHDPDTLGRQPRIASRVVAQLVGEVVVGAVDLNRKFPRRRVKIQNKGTDGMLPTEPKSIEPSCPQAIPKQDFGEVEIAT